MSQNCHKLYEKPFIYWLIICLFQLRCSISLEQICYTRSQGIAVISLQCLLFLDIKKQRLKTNLKKGYQCSVSTEISLNLKVCFSLVAY